LSLSLFSIFGTILGATLFFFFTKSFLILKYSLSFNLSS
jgi:hypothetical protein